MGSGVITLFPWGPTDPVLRTEAAIHLSSHFLPHSNCAVKGLPHWMLGFCFPGCWCFSWRSNAHLTQDHVPAWDSPQLVHKIIKSLETPGLQPLPWPFQVLVDLFSQPFLLLYLLAWLGVEGFPLTGVLWYTEWQYWVTVHVLSEPT